MISVLEPEVGCGYELLAANPQSAHEAGCEIGDGGGDCDLGGPVPLDRAKIIKQSRRAPDYERAPAG